MNDVSFLRFLNVSDAAVQCEILSLVHELELEEPDAFGVRALGVQQRPRQSFGSFEADRALEALFSTPIFRPYYKPDLSVFVPFYHQLELFPL